MRMDNKGEETMSEDVIIHSSIGEHDAKFDITIPIGVLDSPRSIRIQCWSAYKYKHQLHMSDLSDTVIDLPNHISIITCMEDMRLSSVVYATREDCQKILRALSEVSKLF